jgi:hypothetical protein
VDNGKLSLRYQRWQLVVDTRLTVPRPLRSAWLWYCRVHFQSHCRTFPSVVCEHTVSCQTPPTESGMTGWVSSRSKISLAVDVQCVQLRIDHAYVGFGHRAGRTSRLFLRQSIVANRPWQISYHLVHCLRTHPPHTKKCSSGRRRPLPRGGQDPA